MGNMPPDIAEIFDEIEREVLWLHARWKIYRQLFEHSKERIELLDACASNFFLVVQHGLIDGILITICKLTDPDRDTRGNENLVLKLLQRRIVEQGEDKLSDILQKIIDEIDVKSKDFKVHRNKRLAHYDLNVSLLKNIKQLPEITIRKIEDVLKLFSEYMNSIQKYYFKSKTAYSNPSIRGGADKLIEVLKEGLRYKELYQEDVVDWDDLQKSEWKDA